MPLSEPKPLRSFDVGVAENGSLLFRDSRGAVTSEHPSHQPSESVELCMALLPDGRPTAPLQPPPDSPLDLCPDASGAMCYVDRGSGEAQWNAPTGSTKLEPRPLLARALAEPPCFPPGLGFAALHGTQWFPLYSDRRDRVHLYHAETGAVREAPWVSLRHHRHGVVYFANLFTQETRWFPPRRWMEGWVSRPHGELANLQDVLFAGHRLDAHRLPLALARQRIEGGALPLLYERGVPQYPPDADDTPDTHPLPIACC